MAWYNEAIFYHIYPLGMLDAPKVNDYSEVVHRLRELDKWIGHIKGIGCNAIYIGPLFKSVGHGYETTDYKTLDNRLGDNEDLKNFVANCHKEGIRVILDGVFNHTGRDFFAFKDIQANRENSRYKDWYCNVNFYGNNEYNDGFSYDNWGGYNLMAKLNQRNPEVKNYIADVIRYWVSEFDIDGLRLDAADVLDFDFMQMLHGVAAEVKADFWLMGEVIHGDYSRWVNDHTLHAVTNYTLHKALFSGHNDHNYFEIAHTVRRLYEMGGNRVDGLGLYNFSDNHDVARIVNKLDNRANYLPVHILVYTLPGVPSIYYGSEFGIEGEKYRGGPDDAIRPALDFRDLDGVYKDNAYASVITAIARVRQEVKSLSYGEYREVSLTNRQFVFSRGGGEDIAIIAVNNDENPASVWGNNLPDGDYKGLLKGIDMKIVNGGFSVEIPANSGEIWVKAGFSDASLSDFEIGEIKDMKEAEPVESKDNQAEEIPAVESKDNQAEEILAAESKDNQAEESPSASAKYNLSSDYNDINPDKIRQRTDYENMTVNELQVAILEKMSNNGPVDSQMLRTVKDNVYKDSLINWVKSFR